MIRERFGAQSDLCLLDGLRKASESARRIFARAALLASVRETIWFVVGAALEHLRLHMAITLKVLERAALGSIDRYLVEVDGPQPRQLRILIREQATLQQWIFREVDPGRNVGRQEGDLFGLREEIIGITVQNHSSDDFERHHFLGNDLGGIKDVEGKIVGQFLTDELDAKLPFGKTASIYSLKQIAAMIIGICTGDLYSLVPACRLRAEFWTPMKLHERCFSRILDEAKRVDTKAFHHPE